MNISPIYKEVETELSLLNNKILEITSSKHQLVSEIFSHIITSGKRVRPIVVILIAKAFGVKNMDGVVNSAFAVEMIHTASLLHDDVVDETKKRRGKKTANNIWGNKETILVGDHLFTQAFLAISLLGNHKAVECIANASHNLTIGEITQLANERNTKITKNEYLEIIYNKTASLFEASAYLGALFANDVNLDLCCEFGKNIGYAFQIVDDILDYTGSKLLSKDTGTDFRECKVTLPIILLLQHANNAEKAAITNHFLGKQEMQFFAIQQMVKAYEIEHLCTVEVEIYVASAIKFVEGFIVNEEIKRSFLTLLQFFTSRQV